MTEENRLRGKRSRAAGARFELKTRADLEKKGWIVCRWNNQVEMGRLISAKPGFFRSTRTGFPDFLIYRGIMLGESGIFSYEVIGIECKLGKYLSAEEKQKCKWLLENRVFREIKIASRGTKRGEINYETFQSSNVQ